jgi:hypothetical protein
MTKLHTLKEIAGAIAKSESRRDEAKIYQQLRGAASRDLLRHTDSHGPKGALRFNEREVAAARMFLRFVDSGAVGDSLKELRSAMESETRKSFPGGSHKLLSLPRAVVAKDEDWWLEIVVSRDHETGEPGQAVNWIVNGNRFGAPDPLSPDSYVPGATIEEVRLIPFTALVQPVLQALREMAN